MRNINVRTAFVHDWLDTYRGGEKVLEALLELYPEAPVYTLFYKNDHLPKSITSRVVIYPKLLNLFRKFRKFLLPVLPHFVERLDLSEFDLVVSTSSCVAKGVKTREDAFHLCYIHSPMRYIWDQQPEYLESIKHISFAVGFFKLITPYLRRWDVESSARVDQFVVNSSFVGKRVENLYKRSSVVIHPPIELERFQIQKQKNEKDYFIVAGAFVSYKRFDVAIKACVKAGKRLVVAGSGSMEKEWRKHADDQIEFVIRPSDEQFLQLIQGAKALIFPGVEDFGMIAIEAMACGVPVIAHRQGGALDFIKEGQTGRLFDNANLDELITILDQFDADEFSSEDIRGFAMGFSKKLFLEKMREQLQLGLSAGGVQ